jgi:serine/threonine-protein kinase
MGEVYRARDSRLKRDVALKVLPDELAGDPERLARFEREAQALAALKHPHIASIYGIEEKGGVRALVLELAEGETLAERIARGPLPVPEAVAIARQIADALEAAHQHGIVHRDLKPANIQIAHDGIVKVLDFGLARIVGFESAPIDGGPNSSKSPTITSPALVTGANVLMGTAAYMAPEQARGKPADRRADIWAFGVVLYEMLTGARAFAGETITEVAGAVIHKELDLSALPDGTPASVHVVLRGCLRKEPRDRIRDIGDVRLALDGAFDPPAASRPLPRARSVWRSVAIGSAVALTSALAAAAVVWTLTRPERTSRSPVQFDVPTPPAGGIERSGVALSPDGRHLAFIAPDAGENRLWVHSFQDAQSRVVAPSESVRLRPLWSPDSQSLAFLADAKIKKIALTGGPVQTVTEVKSYSGGCWLADTIVVAGTTGLLRVSAAGGVPAALTELDAARSETFHAGAAPLPDGRHFLYFRGSKDASTAGVYLGRVDANPKDQNLTRLMGIGTLPIYASDEGDGNGRLLFIQNRVLMSQSFDPERLALVGEPVRVATVDSVHVSEIFHAVSASANGAIAYRRGGSELASLVLVGKDGQESGTIAARLDKAEHPRLSPDGRSVAVIVERELWKYDLDGRPPIKLTFDGALSPVWSPDGKKIVYEGGGTLRAVLADGSGKPEQVATKGHFHPHSVTPDSREVVAAHVAEGGSAAALVRLALHPDAKPERIAQGGFSAALSPDGRWLAYSDETTGAQEIWVRPYPGPGAPIRVSPHGGGEPLWARNGRELFYLQGKQMMAVAVDTAMGFNFKPAVPLYETSHFRSNQPPSYDVTRDGRFIVLKPDGNVQQPITVILNWTGMLQPASATVH